MCDEIAFCEKEIINEKYGRHPPMFRSQFSSILPRSEINFYKCFLYFQRTLNSSGYRKMDISIL